MEAHSHELYMEADRARNRGEHARAIEIYEALSKDGHVYSLVLLGDMYAKGLGTPLDLDKAEQLFSRAASLGMPEAMLQKASIWYERGDMRRYFLAVQQAAHSDLLVAQYYLGVCYVYGRGVSRDDAKGLALVKGAADRGHLRAKAFLARRLISKPQNPIGLMTGIVKLLGAILHMVVVTLFVDRDDERVR